MTDLDAGNRKLVWFDLCIVAVKWWHHKTSQWVESALQGKGLSDYAVAVTQFNRLHVQGLCRCMSVFCVWKIRHWKHWKWIMHNLETVVHHKTRHYSNSFWYEGKHVVIDMLCLRDLSKWKSPSSLQGNVSQYYIKQVSISCCCSLCFILLCCPAMLVSTTRSFKTC